MRTLRKLVFGETWTVPIGVALTLAAGLILRGAGWWVGFVLLAGVDRDVVCVAAASTLRGGCPPCPKPANRSATGSPAPRRCRGCAVRKRREAREMAARWRARVSEAERLEYGAGLLGAALMMLAERRLPITTRHTGRTLVKAAVWTAVRHGGADRRAARRAARRGRRAQSVLT